MKLFQNPFLQRAFFFRRRKKKLPLLFFALLSLSCGLFSQEAPVARGKKLPLHIEKVWLLGHLDYKKDRRFIRVPKAYTKKTALYLHRESYAAFRRLHSAARKEGITLEILSGARSFKEQKWIWERKWKRLSSKKKGGREASLARAKKILEYSSIPGTSRHHWGTDLDLNSLQNSYFKKGEGKRLYRWLRQNARNFGFCQVYTKKSKMRPHGYNEESWHWSYLPLARPLARAYLKRILYDDIKGFLGAESAKELNIIRHYVDGVDPSCK